LFHGVPARPTHFVGRKDILERLVARLKAGDNISVSVGGAGGAGKTTLAVEVAHNSEILSHFREGILWAALGKHPAIDAILAEWATAFALDVSTLAEPSGRAKTIKNAVGMRSILFIIDDVWDEESASLLRCGGPNCAYLLTTRDDRIARHFAGPSGTEKIAELDPIPAFELLQYLAPEVCAAEPESAKGLVDATGGLPLAIELLGGYLGDPEHSGLVDLRTAALREMFDPTRRLLLARERLGGRSGERPTLEQTIALSLEDLPPQVVQAFYCLGAFAPKPDSFDVAVAQLVANAETSWWGILLRRNLVENPDGERLSIHPVLAEYAASRMPSEAVVRHRTAYADFLVTQAGKWWILDREYSQIRYAWSLWDGDAHGKIVFVERVLELQRLRRWWRDHISWAEDALKIAYEKGWKKHISKLLLALGVTYGDMGQRQRALTYFESVIPLYEEAGDQGGLAVTLNNIGTVYLGLGEWHKALEYFERAIEASEETGIKLELAMMLSNIARVYDGLGKPLDALRYDERALSVFEEVGDRSGLGIMLNNIGSVHHGLGQPQVALAYYERALTIMEELGHQHGLAATLNNMGGVYGELDQQELAMQCYERALRIAEVIGDQPDFAKTLHNIGVAYNRMEKWQEALMYFERAVPITEELRDWVGLASILNNIGLATDRLGQRQEALEHYRQALSITEEIGDRAGEALARFLIAIAYYKENRLAEAVEQLRCSVELGKAAQIPALEEYLLVLHDFEVELAALPGFEGPDQSASLGA
jgi:tetratricopeptide (TPR) repeat protein